MLLFMSCKVDFVFHLLEEKLVGFPLLKDQRGKVGKKTRENEKKRKEPNMNVELRKTVFRV